MANETKSGASASANASPFKAVREASNAIVDALAGLEREDQLRALDAAVSILGIKKRPNPSPPPKAGSK